MNLSKKNIVEGIIGSLLASAILFLIGLLLSSIDIVIVDKPNPNPNTPSEWDIKIHPITINLPYEFTDVGQEVSKFRTSLNNFFYTIKENNFWMMIFVGFIWVSLYLTLPSIRWSNIKEIYVNRNLRKPTKGRLDYSKVDTKKHNASYIFNWLFVVYLLAAIAIFVLFRDWFLSFLLAIFMERLLWILTVFIDNKQIHNERSVLINSCYIMLSLPISILLTLIFTIILSYIF